MRSSFLSRRASSLVAAARARRPSLELTTGFEVTDRRLPVHHHHAERDRPRRSRTTAPSVPRPIRATCTSPTSAIRSRPSASPGRPTSARAAPRSSGAPTPATATRPRASGSPIRPISPARDPPSVGIHQVHLCGLAAGTTYHYRVGTGTHMSADATFTTAPGDGRPVRVLVAGDSRGNAATLGPGPAGRRRRRARRRASSPATPTTSARSRTIGKRGSPPATACIEHLPLMMVHGNHEINSRHYYSQFPLPGNQQWYSFDFGAAHFTALNDTPPSSDPTSITSEQAPFLDGDLGKTPQPWKLVTHHRPEYTSSTGHPPATDLQHGVGVDRRRAPRRHGAQRPRARLRALARRSSPGRSSPMAPGRCTSSRAAAAPIPTTSRRRRSPRSRRRSTATSSSTSRRRR